jgi:hypothetical protein
MKDSNCMCSGCHASQQVRVFIEGEDNMLGCVVFAEEGENGIVVQRLPEGWQIRTGKVRIEEGTPGDGEGECECGGNCGDELP